MLRKVLTIRINGCRYNSRITVRSYCSAFSNANNRTLFPYRYMQLYRSQQLLKWGLLQYPFNRVLLSIASLTFFQSKKMNTFEDCVFTARLNTSLTTVKHMHLSHSDNGTQGPFDGSGSSRNCHYIQENYNPQETSEELREYEEAVKTVNCLQSNALTIHIATVGHRPNTSLEDTLKYLLRSGLTLEDLRKLSFIHVSGTKGKGSTCALTESILRSSGIATGFYSSPHLVSLTERIKINGQPISKPLFTQSFWPVYNKLLAAQDGQDDMPGYFMFLTILSFHIFLKAAVDVVILEVGIGGELDCTNIIPNAKTIGITSLGLEHTQLLGDSLEEIAWQKAGIIKPGSRVYTNVTQPECLEVIAQRAQEKQAKIYLVPPIDSYFHESQKQVLDHFNPVTILNGSLAIQLAYDWLRHNAKYSLIENHDPKMPRKPNCTYLSEAAIMGLVNCSWPGRCQVINYLNFNIYMDGAHTAESMSVCSKWFAHKTISNEEHLKVLIFNTTGKRNSRQLLEILSQSNHFDLVCFVPNISTINDLGESLITADRVDIQSVHFKYDDQLERPRYHLELWHNLFLDLKVERSNALVCPTVLDCFYHLQDYAKGVIALDILVTGSLHLLGATILSLNQLSSGTPN